MCPTNIRTGIMQNYSHLPKVHVVILGTRRKLEICALKWYQWHISNLSGCKMTGHNLSQIKNWLGKQNLKDFCPKTILAALMPKILTVT